MDYTMLDYLKDHVQHIALGLLVATVIALGLLLIFEPHTVVEYNGVVTDKIYYAPYTTTDTICKTVNKVTTCETKTTYHPASYYVVVTGELEQHGFQVTGDKYYSLRSGDRVKYLVSTGEITHAQWYALE